jgi:hypothetical protein
VLQFHEPFSLLLTLANILRLTRYCTHISFHRPLLRYSGQRYCLQIRTSRVRFQALPYFLSNSRPETRPTQHREDNCGAT